MKEKNEESVKDLEVNVVDVDNDTTQVVDEKALAAAQLLEELKPNRGHLVKAVPYGEAEWYDGYIKNVTLEPRTNKVMYEIKLNDGRTIRKVHSNKLLTILPELANVPEKQPRQKVEREELNDEQITDLYRTYAPLIGTILEHNGATGRVVGLVLDKRVNMLLARIKVINEEGERFIHKSLKPEDLELAIADELTEELAANWLERFERRINKAEVTKEEKITALKAKIEATRMKLEELEHKLAGLEAEDATEELA